MNVTTLYRSQSGSQRKLNDCLAELAAKEKDMPDLVIGDFNFCYLDSTSNITKHYLKSQNYLQLIHKPTHIEGNILDQAYVKDVKKT